MAKEFDLLRVPGEPWRGECGSELCLNRDKFSSPPRLERPVVDVEVLPLPVVNGGGVPMSCETRPKELVVDARSLIPRRIGGCSGEEFDEARDRWESLRKRLRPGSANDKDCAASAALVECFVGLVSVCLLDKAVVGRLLPFSVACSSCMGNTPVDARGVGGSSGCWSSSCGGGILIGSGNSELRFLLRRASLKNVVCVETVCVVVVVEP